MKEMKHQVKFDGMTQTIYEQKSGLEGKNNNSQGYTFIL
jgi:hypothetical protein